MRAEIFAGKYAKVYKRRDNSSINIEVKYLSDYKYLKINRKEIILQKE